VPVDELLSYDGELSGFVTGDCLGQLTSAEDTVSVRNVSMRHGYRHLIL
jgi:hypothetical protein